MEGLMPSAAPFWGAAGTGIGAGSSHPSRDYPTEEFTADGLLRVGTRMEKVSEGCISHFTPSSLAFSSLSASWQPWGKQVFSTAPSRHASTSGPAKHGLKPLRPWAKIERFLTSGIWIFCKTLVYTDQHVHHTWLLPFDFSSFIQSQTCLQSTLVLVSIL